jgi:hypothetical protein
MSFPVLITGLPFSEVPEKKKKNIFRYIVQEEKKIVKAQHNTPKTKNYALRRNKIKTTWGFLSQ